MLKKITPSDELKIFSDLLINAFNSSFNAILGKPYDFLVSNIEKGELNDIALEFMGQTFIKLVVDIKEMGEGIFGGMLIKTSDITALADLMLMGPGEGVEDLNDDLKDAIKELISQTISAMNVPFREKFGKEATFRTLSVDKLMDTSVHKEEIIIFHVNSPQNISFVIYFGSKIQGIISRDTKQDDMFDFDVPDELSVLNSAQSVSKHNAGNKNIDLLRDVEVPVSIRIGSTRMFLKDIVSLSPGNIVELDEYAEDPVIVLVNNKPIAKGEVVIVDGYFGVRIKEIISKEERIKKLRD